MPVEAFLAGLETVSTAGENAVDVDCLLDRPTDAIYIRSMILALLPSFAAVALAVGWKVQCHLVGDSRDGFRGKFHMSLIVVYCTIFASVTRSAVMLLQCEPRGLDRTPFLFLDQDIECWSAEHWPWVVLAAASLASFTVGFPVSAILLMRSRSVPQVIDRWMSEDLHAEDQLTLTAYAYLFKGYKSRYFYWEFIIVLRKLLVLVISIAFVGGANVPAQSSLLALVLVCLMLAHVLCQPFQDEHLNLVELLSLFATTCLFVSGQLIHSGGLGDGASIAFSVTTIALLTIFLVAMVLNIAWHWWRSRAATAAVARAKADLDQDQNQNQDQDQDHIEMTGI